MAFRRNAAVTLPERADLTSSMIGIGMLFGGVPLDSPNIEDTVLAASIEGMDRGDLRVLSVLTTWFGVHAEYVNADRLTRIVAGQSPLVRAYWSSVVQTRPSDRRFRRLFEGYEGSRVELLPVGTQMQILRRGEDDRFAGGPLAVPAGTLRDRVDDVMTPSELAARHRAYYWRVVIGPSYRADVWAAMESDPEAKPADLGRRTYASFATAWEVRRDYLIASRRALHSKSVDASMRVQRD
jgi:hypothetical protein